MFAAKNTHKVIIDSILDVVAFVRARGEPGRALETRLGGQGEVYGLLYAHAHAKSHGNFAPGVYVSTTTKDVSL